MIKHKLFTLTVLFFICYQLPAQNPKKSEIIALNNTEIYYEVYGEGTPLFLLHGYTLSSQAWRPYVEDFYKDYEVYLVDLTGHGKSEMFTSDLSIPSVAQDFITLVDYLKLEKIKAIGFSFGGDILYQVALKKPKLIEAMITIGAVGSWDVNDFKNYQEAFTFENKDNFPWLVEYHQSDEQIRALMEQFKNYTIHLSDEELNQIKPEVMIMVGDNDNGMDISEIARVRKNLPQSDLWILPDVAHGAHEGASKSDFIKKSKAFFNKNTGSPYLGMNPPGRTPEIFAPGIVSVNGRYEYAVSFSPDLEEMYFSGNKEGGAQNVFFSQFKDKKWSDPKKVRLTQGAKSNELEAFVDPSGKGLFFAAYDSIFADERIWHVKRLENGWSDAIKLESPVNDAIVFYSNTAENGDLYYTNISEMKMYYAPNKNGKFPEAKEVGIQYGIHGFISPAQDFMLVDAPKENDPTKDRDIHVCFRQKDGTWSKPMNLGKEVNSDFTETCPSLSPDGKYLFFSRYNEEGGISNIYWVSTELIKELAQKASK